MVSRNDRTSLIYPKILAAEFKEELMIHCQAIYPSWLSIGDLAIGAALQEIGFYRFARSQKSEVGSRKFFQYLIYQLDFSVFKQRALGFSTPKFLPCGYSISVIVRPTNCYFRLPTS